MSEKSRHYRTYTYCLDNPTRFIDSDGMQVTDNFVINENGQYVGTEENDDPDKLVIENSVDHSRTTYDFNDPEVDVKAINNAKEKFGEAFKHIKFVHFVNDELIDEFMKKNDVHYRNWFNRRWFALNESYHGKMDHTYSSLLWKFDIGSMFLESELLEDKGPLIILPGAMVYNLFDAGNWLWGDGMNRLGFDYFDTRDASLFNDPEDTKADQNAIMRGYFYEKSKNR